MLNYENVVDLVESKCQERGATIRSRQIRAVIDVVVREVNDELLLINERFKKLESVKKKKVVKEYKNDIEKRLGSIK